MPINVGRGIGTVVGMLIIAIAAIGVAPEFLIQTANFQASQYLSQFLLLELISDFWPLLLVVGILTLVATIGPTLRDAVRGP